MNKRKKGQGTMFYRILQLLMRIPVLQNIRILFYFYDKFVLCFLPKSVKAGEERKRVLVVFPFALGDCVLFLGAIQNMRKIYPADAYHVSIACQRGYEGLFTEYFNDVLSFEYTKASVNPVYRIKMWKQLRQTYYDIVIDPIGCEECSPNVFTVNAVCADEKIGVLPASDKKVQCPKWMRQKIYSRIFSVDEKNIHRIRYYALVWGLIGKTEGTACLAKLPGAKLDYELPDKYFVVFPSASLPVKQWPVERFAEVTRRIYQKTGLKLVVCGTGHDAAVIGDFLTLIPDVPVYNLLNKTNVNEFIEIIGRAELLLTNDTSAYHIGVAQKIKVCIVTGRYVYSAFIHYQYQEVDDSKLAIVCRDGLCYNCENMCRFKIKETYPCVEENSVEEVWKAVEKLLDEEESE